MNKKISCPKCDGFGYIAKCETWDYGNGLGGGHAWSEECQNCHGTGIVQIPMTNADRIRAMTDEEMAHFFCKTLKVECWRCPAKDLCYTDHNGFSEWIKQPAEDA